MPRGTQNDTPRPVTAERISDPQPEVSLGTWVRWRAGDEGRTEENRATIRAAVARYGVQRVQAVAERLQLAGGPQRPPGAKCWPDELLPALIAEDAAAASPAVTTTADTRPAVVRAAFLLLARHGDDACRQAMGWAPTVAPTPEALRSAFDRDATAQALVDHFTPATAGATT